SRRNEDEEPGNGDAGTGPRPFRGDRDARLLAPRRGQGGEVMAPAPFNARRFGATVRNVLEVARFGGLETGEEPAPFAVIAEGRVHRVRRYFADAPAGVPVVMVPPLMLTAEVYDVSPQASAVRTLYEHGIDPWVV